MTLRSITATASLVGYAFSPGVWAVIALAIISSLVVFSWTAEQPETDATMWTFAAPHYAIYEPSVTAWNAEGGFTVDMSQISRQVMDRRLVGGFLGGVPTADLIEAERSTASLAFAGPLEAVGFVDLTDRIEADGLFESITPASFSPWTFEGRVFGLPHDVHPVMLGYRADIVEAAGIDVNQIETWDDFFRVMAPVMTDEDGDGDPDRYILSLWDTNSDMVETMLLQAGGGAFLPDGTLAIDREINAMVASTIVSWMVGPDRVAADVPEFSATGNALKRDGYAVAYIMPDWMCNIWRRELPQLAGKVKLMPMPAWEPGGRRTSVWGGSMLGIAKTAENQDELWEFAKKLYFSDELAQELYVVGDIITPVRENWDNPIYDEPDEYFGGQPKGRMYIELADQVPPRAASPFFSQARGATQQAISRLKDYAIKNETYEPSELMQQARIELKRAHDEIALIIGRNAFHRDRLKPSQPPAESGVSSVGAP